MSKPCCELQRIRVRVDGYDADGAYWGAGPDVFIATSADGADQITVRAKSVTEARKKIDAELARAAGEARKDRETLGGNAPRKTRYQIAWRDPVNKTTIDVRITHSRDYLSSGTDHIEVESLRPKKAPLPITETGYRSHFIPPLDLMNAGGPVTFVTAWLDQEAKGKSWCKAASIKAQGDLFSWAEANREVGKPRSAKRSKTPRAVALRRRKPSADPA